MSSGFIAVNEMHPTSMSPRKNHSSRGRSPLRQIAQAELNINMNSQMTIADSDKDVASGKWTENGGKCRRHEPEKFDHHSCSPSDQNSHSPNATQVTPPSKKRKPRRGTCERTAASSDCRSSKKKAKKSHPCKAIEALTEIALSFKKIQIPHPATDVNTLPGPAPTSEEYTSHGARRIQPDRGVKSVRSIVHEVDPLNPDQPKCDWAEPIVFLLDANASCSPVATSPASRYVPSTNTSVSSAEPSPSKDCQRRAFGKNAKVKEAWKALSPGTGACGVSDNHEDPIQDLARVKRELTVALDSKAQEIESRMASHASDDLLPGDGPTFRKAERKKQKASRTEVAALRSLIEDYRAAADATRRETLLWIQEGFETLRKQPPSALQHPPTDLGHSQISSMHKNAAIAPFPTTSTIETSMEWTSGPAQQHRSSPQKWKSTTPKTSPRPQEMSTLKSAHRQEGTTNNSPLTSNKKSKKKKKRKLETWSCTENDKNVESATGKTPTHHWEQTMTRVLHDAPTPQQGVEILPLGPSKQPGSRDRRDSVESHPPSNPSQARNNPGNSRPTAPMTNSAQAQNLPTVDRTKASASNPPKAAKRPPVPSTTAAMQSQRKDPRKYHASKVPQTRVWNTASHYREISMPLRDSRSAQCTCSELPDHFLNAGPAGPNFGTWTGGMSEYLCHCEQILACRGHSDMMRRSCREFYETEWPRFERQQCARAKEAAARGDQTKGSMSNAQFEAIIGEAHDFLADRRAEKDQQEAQSNRPVARQHSTVPASIFFHGIPPRSNFRIPPGLPYATPPELGSPILGVESLNDRPSPPVLPGQPCRSQDPIPTSSSTDRSVDVVVAANNEDSHSGVSSTESCSSKAMPSASVSVKSATAHHKTPSPAKSAKMGKKRKRQHSTISQQSPKRLRHQSHLDNAALESEPQAAQFQPSCSDDKETSDGENLDQFGDQESTRLGEGRCSQVRRNVDDDYMAAMAFFDDDEIFPNGPPSPVHNASSPRPFVASAFMSGALTDHEAGIGAHTSTPTSPSPKGRILQASEANNENNTQPNHHWRGSHIRFDELSTPERRDRSIYRRYGTEPVLCASQLSPADAVRRQVANIGRVFKSPTAADTSLQPKPSESRSTTTSAPVLGTGTTNATSVAQPRKRKRPKLSLEERKRRFPPILPPYVGESERLSDKVLIKVGTFHRPYERHSSAPYAYRYSSGKLTADYLYLAELKHPNGGFMWEDEQIRKKLTSWKRLS